MQNQEPKMNNLKRNCECCGASYATGKDYGYYWCETPIYETIKITKKWYQFWKSKEIVCIISPKGLCEFCNPNCEKWYIENKKCHNKNQK